MYSSHVTHVHVTQ